MNDFEIHTALEVVRQESDPTLKHLKLANLDKVTGLKFLTLRLPSGVPLSYTYDYNAANQRTQITLADGSYWVYQYDQLGQVISGRRHWADGTPVAGQHFEYGFDDIDNRTSTGGRASAESTYTVNDLEQYDSRTVAGAVEVLGIANPTADHTKPIRQLGGRGSCRALTSGPQDRPPRVGKESQGSAGASPSRAKVDHDADGNLTRDGRWDYEWDAENRLVTMRGLSGSPAPERRIEFEYDWRGRRIRKTVYDDRDAGEDVELSDTVILYDLSAGQAGGWNPLAELDANATKRACLQPRRDRACVVFCSLCLTATVGSRGTGAAAALTSARRAPAQTRSKRRRQLAPPGPPSENAPQRRGHPHVDYCTPLSEN